MAPNAHPIYKFLKDKLPGFLGKRIKWNFTKFLIDRTGVPVKDSLHQQCLKTG